MDGDKLVENPLEEIQRAESFLELPQFYGSSQFHVEFQNGFPCFILGKAGKCMGKDKGREHPLLKDETLKYLNEKFQPMIEMLKEQTGVNLQLKRL